MRSSRLALILLSLLLIGRVASAQTVADSPTSATIAAPRNFSADVSVTDPGSQKWEVGRPGKLALTLNVEGDFDEMALKLSEIDEPNFAAGDIRKSGARQFEATVRPLHSGDLVLTPDFKASAPGKDTVTLHGAPVHIRVEAPPKPTEGEQPKPLTEPAELPFNYLLRNLILAGAGLVVLGFIGGGIWLALTLTRKNIAARGIEPPLPPIQRALKDVRTLRMLDVFRHDGPEGHYTILSMTLRRYIESQFGRSAMEMTEDEVSELLIHGDLRQLRGVRELAPVFTRSSFAKFARQPLTEEDAVRDCEIAEDFLIREKARIDAETNAAAAGVKPS
ncbi:hypothetical protein BH09SUM1_BH09SUM1_23780 [soil metagenome]